AWKHAQQLVGGAFTSGATGEVDAVDFPAGEVEPVDLPGSFDRLQVAGREGEVGESHPEPEREQGDDECRSAEREEVLRTRIDIGEESRPALDQQQGGRAEKEQPAHAVSNGMLPDLFTQ